MHDDRAVRVGGPDLHDAALRDLYIILHTSLSGVFNQVMVEKVGADLFVPKFNADELGQAVLEHWANVERAVGEAA